MPPPTRALTLRVHDTDHPATTTLDTCLPRLQLAVNTPFPLVFTQRATDDHKPTHLFTSTSDGGDQHAGIRSADAASLPRALWQRCPHTNSSRPLIKSGRLSGPVGGHSAQCGPGQDARAQEHCAARRASSRTHTSARQAGGEAQTTARRCLGTGYWVSGS